MELFATKAENIVILNLPFDTESRIMLCLGNYLPVDENGPAVLGNIFAMSDREFKRLFKKYMFNREKAKEILGNLRRLTERDYIIVKKESIVYAYPVKKNGYKMHIYRQPENPDEYYEIFCIELDKPIRIPREKLGEAYDRLPVRKALSRIVKVRDRIVKAIEQTSKAQA